MQLLFDFLPILAFFVAFKFFDIYIATGTAIIISFLLVAFHWFKHHSIPRLLLINLAVISIFGGSTLLLHNELFIKWKPTVLNWVLAVIFVGSRFFTSKPLIQRMLEENISLPDSTWSKLNLAWVIFFLLMGLINILVAYNFDTNTWVNFKLFGILGLTLLFAVLQAVYLTKFIKEKP